ncbi:MAG: helix-turn-helix domain-containing protein [Kiritimatiellia bacterium]|jgi:AraC family transcriptional regulator|nr:helix-turn-helix domain-containing protein [Kiritimatiellia bacterium]
MIATNHTAGIWQVATALRDRLDEGLRVIEMARGTGLSERQFHRLFQTVLRESPGDHVARLRQERAAAWLAYTDLPVIDAALAGGYESREAFTRAFRERFGCTPGVFRDRMRLRRERISVTPPPGVGAAYEITLPPMRVAAWPHLGPARNAASVWLKLGRWGHGHGFLTPHTLPVTVLYDDAAITSPPHARIDAALVLDPACQAIPSATVPPFMTTLPGGRHLILPFAGPLSALGPAWDFFAMRCFAASGHALRDSRMLMLHDPTEVPTRACEFFPLVTGHPLHCRLCIPIDRVPAQGLPPVHATRERNGAANARHAPA